MIKIIVFLMMTFMSFGEIKVSLVSALVVQHTFKSDAVGFKNEDLAGNKGFNEGFLKNEMIGLDLRKEKVSLTLITFKNSFYDRSNGVLLNYWKSAGRSKKTEFSFSLGLVDGYKKEQGLCFISDKAVIGHLGVYTKVNNKTSLFITGNPVYFTAGIRLNLN